MLFRSSDQLSRPTKRRRILAPSNPFVDLDAADTDRDDEDFEGADSENEKDEAIDSSRSRSHLEEDLDDPDDNDVDLGISTGMSCIKYPYIKIYILPRR